MTLSDFIDATAAVEADLFERWQKSKNKVTRDIASAVLEKSSLREHYWEDHYKLEQQLRATRSLHLVLVEIQREEGM
jgi:hypothetical protein